MSEDKSETSPVPSSVLAFWQETDGRATVTEIICACGCGKMVKVEPIYLSPACRVRAKRKRDKI